MLMGASGLRAQRRKARLNMLRPPPAPAHDQHQARGPQQPYLPEQMQVLSAGRQPPEQGLRHQRAAHKPISDY